MDSRHSLCYAYVCSPGKCDVCACMQAWLNTHLQLLHDGYGAPCTCILPAHFHRNALDCSREQLLQGQGERELRSSGAFQAVVTLLVFAVSRLLGDCGCGAHSQLRSGSSSSMLLQEILEHPGKQGLLILQRLQNGVNTAKAFCFSPSSAEKGRENALAVLLLHCSAKERTGIAS